jgi:hypothetical protein
MIRDTLDLVAGEIRGCPNGEFGKLLDLSPDVTTLAPFSLVQNENALKLFHLQNYETTSTKLQKTFYKIPTLFGVRGVEWAELQGV